MDFAIKGHCRESNDTLVSTSAGGLDGILMVYFVAEMELFPDMELKGWGN